MSSSTLLRDIYIYVVACKRFCCKDSVIFYPVAAPFSTVPSVVGSNPTLYDSLIVVSSLDVRCVCFTYVFQNPSRHRICS